jgi:hypothetical protein
MAMAMAQMEPHLSQYFQGISLIKGRWRELRIFFTYYIITLKEFLKLNLASLYDAPEFENNEFCSDLARGR